MLHTYMHACMHACQPAGPASGAHAQGLTPFGDSGETSTRGLETLEADCRQYRAQGARFTKWRAALKVGNGLPSEAAVKRNAEELATYAATVQV